MTADNFDEQHVSDIRITNVGVYNTDPKSNIQDEAKPDPRDEVDYDNLQARDLFKAQSEENKRRGGVGMSDMHNVKEADDDATILQKVHELQTLYKQNLKIYLREFQELDANTEAMISFGKDRSKELTEIYQNIEQKMQSVAYGKLDSLSKFDQKDFNKINNIMNLIAELDNKIGKY